MSGTDGPRPRIAVFSGATATIQNSEPLVTSNKARQQRGLPPRTDAAGRPLRFDALRPQRLAAPVTLYVEQFSAHPLERDAAELYSPPDGYVDASGAFHRQRTSPGDTPVYAVTLRPEDGLYPLPYMAFQADGQPWEGDCTEPGAPAGGCRQPFYPDGSRLLEEIDRLGVGDAGLSSLLSSRADFDFHRVVPSGGYRRGLAAGLRTDAGEGDIPPERLGRDFFPYRPEHLRAEPPAAMMARAANGVQRALASGLYAGGIWLEGSPNVEETTYWLSLMVDTALPIAGNASQRAHGSVGNDGDRNIIDSVDYILSGIWRDQQGRDAVGAVVIQDEQIFAAREVQKADARPGGYVATGGHGGIVGSMGQPGPAVLAYIPARRHTHTSEVSLSRLPPSVPGLRGAPVRVLDGAGDLLGEAVPEVSFAKHGRYMGRGDDDAAESEVGILARIQQNLRQAPLAGFVAEGTAPFARLSPPADEALLRAVFSGMPVVRVGRGNAEGFVPPDRQGFTISGSNLTANKARLLLIACLLRFGSLPAAADPARPTPGEEQAVRERVAQFQRVFDTH